MLKRSRKPQPNALLKRERKKVGWSQEMLADKVADLAEKLYGGRLGPNPKTVSRWEQGKCYPSPFYQTLLCLLFDKTTFELGLIPPDEFQHLVEENPSEVLVLPPKYATPDLPVSDSPAQNFIVIDPDILKDQDASHFGQSGGRQLILRPPSSIQPSDLSGYLQVRNGGGRSPNRRRRWLIAAGIALGASIAGIGSAVIMRAFSSRPQYAWPTISYDPDRAYSVVRIIQWMLKNRGYLLGVNNPSGTFSTQTKDAVRLFRENKGLPVGDFVDGVAWEQLIMISKRGNTGFHVLALQQQLNERGARPELALDSDFGPLTLRAVQDFRKKIGLPDMGGDEFVANMECWYHLVRLAFEADMV